jgi:hypothetical protein
MKTEKEIKAICDAFIREELSARTDEIIHNAAYQAMAVTFYILSRDYGFGKQRLANLKDAIEDEFYLMDIGILGKPYTTSHTINYLKDKFNIDFGVSKFDRK